MKKSLFSFLVIAVLCVLSFSVFAADFKDVSSSHWAESAIERWHDEGILNGDGNGNFRPEDSVTRAEFVTMLVRIFEPEAAADITSYKDVKKSAWYYDYIAKAVAFPALNGDNSSRMRPEEEISRQEAISIINRIVKISHSKNADLKQFSDYADVASWAKDDVTALVEHGYVNGYDDGTLKPKANISRAEAAKILDNLIGMIIKESGSYDLSNVKGFVIVKAENVTLKNADKVDGIFALNAKVADSMKVSGFDSKDVGVINGKKEEEKKTSSGGGGGATPIGTVVINDDGTYYTFKKKSGTVAAGSKVKFVYGDDEELIINETITKNSYEKIVDAVLAKLTDTDKLMKTLSDKYSEEELSNKLGSEAFKDVTDVRGTILEVYNALKALDMSDEDIVSAIKAVVTYDDVKSALTYIK